MPIQLVVSPDTGGVQDVFVWQEGHRWQAAVKFQQEDGMWHAYLEPIEGENDENLPLVPDYVLVGFFPTLHAALNTLSAHEDAPVREFSGTVYGEVVVG